MSTCVECQEEGARLHVRGNAFCDLTCYLTWQRPREPFCSRCGISAHYHQPARFERLPGWKAQLCEAWTA